MGANNRVKDIDREIRATKPLRNLALQELDIILAIAMRNKDFLVLDGLEGRCFHVVDHVDD